MATLWFGRGLWPQQPRNLHVDVPDPSVSKHHSSRLVVHWGLGWGGEAHAQRVSQRVQAALGLCQMGMRHKEHGATSTRTRPALMYRALVSF